MYAIFLGGQGGRGSRGVKCKFTRGFLFAGCEKESQTAEEARGPRGKKGRDGQS